MIRIFSVLAYFTILLGLLSAIFAQALMLAFYLIAFGVVLVIGLSYASSAATRRRRQDAYWDNPGNW